MHLHREYTFELIQGGIKVAIVTAARREDAQREIGHYALMYAPDGPMEIREVSEKK